MVRQPRSTLSNAGQTVFKAWMVCPQPISPRVERASVAPVVFGCKKTRKNLVRVGVGTQIFHVLDGSGLVAIAVFSSGKDQGLSRGRLNPLPTLRLVRRVGVQHPPE